MSVYLSRFSEFLTRRRIAQVVLIATLCLALAAFAQRRLDLGLKDYRAFLAFGLGSLAFAWAFGNVALEVSKEPDASQVAQISTRCARSLRAVPLLLAVSLLGCLDFWGNRFRLVGLILWLGGLLLSMIYLYLCDAPQAGGGRLLDWLRGKPVTLSREWLWLAVAMLVGLAFRLYRLDAVPADIGWDLPYNYADVASILRGEYRIFFPANLGREGLFFYWAALVSRFSPLSHFSLKLASVLAGVAAIPALYLAARRLFGTSVALGAAFLLAVNRWHIVLSRAGFRVILLPLFVNLLLYAFIRALQSRRLCDWGLAGLILGLGLHTYLPFLFAPVAVLTSLTLLVLSGRRLQWRVWLPLLAIMAAVALVVYAPLGRVALENSKEYVARMALQITLLKGGGQRTPMSLSLLLENLRVTALMFNLYGDGNARFNVPAFRHFGFVSGVLLVLGVFYALRRWRHGSNAVLLATFVVFTLPSGLTALPHELPNIFRAAGSIGPGLILAALPVAAIARSLQESGMRLPLWDVQFRLKLSSLDQTHEPVLRVSRRALLALAPLLLATFLLVQEGKETAHFYFSDFVNVLPDRQNVSVAKEMARAMQAYGDLSACHIKLWPYWFDGRALRTYLQREDALWGEDNALTPGQPPLSTIGERALFIVNPADLAALDVLRQTFPHAATVPKLFPDGGTVFIAVYIER